MIGAVDLGMARSVPLAASSYLHPLDKAENNDGRKRIVAQALALGYEEATMVEYGLTWDRDVDPFGHGRVKGIALPPAFSAANQRMFESFAGDLGESGFRDLMHGSSNGAITAFARSWTTEFRKAVSYPDALIIASRFKEVRPDRFYAVLTAWSLHQEVPVAELTGWIIFAKLPEGRPVNLLQVGEPYANLYKSLSERARRSNEIITQHDLRAIKSKSAKL